MIYVGVDPGTTGAIAFLSPAGSSVFDLPTVPIPGNGFVKKRVHGPGLYKILMANAAGQQVVTAIEALASGGRAGFNMSQTQNAMYRTWGTIETVFELAGLTVGAVPPKTWKALYGLAGKQADKDATAQALQVANLFYPDLMHELSRVKDHNRAEAVLIAHWARKRDELASASKQRQTETEF